MADTEEFIVCVRFVGIDPGGAIEEFIVWDRPGGGAAPNIFEKAASLWLFGAVCPYSVGRGPFDPPRG